MARIYGIDVSRYQSLVDWKKVKAAGKEFVFVRLGWAGWDGSINVDSMADSHIKGAKAAGLHVGVYVYSYCKTPEAAKLAAKKTVELIRPYAPITYPIAFDIEDTSESGVRHQLLGKDFNNSIASAFLDEIEEAGYYGLLYTYKSFAENYLNMSALEKYDVWIAQYAANCSYAGPYGIWQYAGDSGRCDGVVGACDLNVAYKDYAALIKAVGLNGHEKAGTIVKSSIEEENKQLREKLAELEDRLGKILQLVS